MQRFFNAFIILVLLQGCSTISREAGYPGGNVGYVADRYALFARGQNEQVNRYLVTLALLAPLIAETVDGSTEAKLSAERIKDLYQNIDKLEKASKKCSLPTPKDLGSKPTLDKIKTGTCEDKDAGNPEGTALSFESLSYDVNKSLNDAMKQTLDNLDIRSNTKKLIALEPTEMLKTILKARHLVPVLMRYLSAYRDVSIVFGFSIAESCQPTVATIDKAIAAEKEKALKDRRKVPNINLKGACVQVASSFARLINRTRHADSDVARAERPISDVFKAGKSALNAGLDWTLNKTHRIALLHHVNRACKKLDALAAIDHKDFEGCEVNLGGAGAEKATKTPLTKTQAAVNSLTKGST